MNNPCDECIVRSMCKMCCILFMEYVDGHLPTNYTMVYMNSYEYLKSLLLHSKDEPSNTFSSAYTISQYNENTHLDLRGERTYPTIIVQNGEIYEVKPMRRMHSNKHVQKTM